MINRSAYDIGTLIYIAYDSQYSETQTQREKTLRYLIRHMDRANDYYSVKDQMIKKFSGTGPSHFPSRQYSLPSSYRHHSHHNPHPYPGSKLPHHAEIDFDVIQLEPDDSSETSQDVSLIFFF